MSDNAKNETRESAGKDKDITTSSIHTNKCTKLM